jgi:2-keto-3-deoxy-6-phosphogluconate aldolase
MLFCPGRNCGTVSEAGYAYKNGDTLVQLFPAHTFYRRAIA